jgi:hypothetical protein
METVDFAATLLPAIAPYVVAVGASARGDMNGRLDLCYDPPDANLLRRLIEESGAYLLEPRPGEWRGQRFRLKPLPPDIDFGVLQLHAWLAPVWGTTLWVARLEAYAGG